MGVGTSKRRPTGVGDREAEQEACDAIVNAMDDVWQGKPASSASRQSGPQVRPSPAVKVGEGSNDLYGSLS